MCSCSPKRWAYPKYPQRRYTRYFILNRYWSWNLPPWTCDAGPGSLWDTEGAQRLSYLLGVLKQTPGVCQVSSIYNQHRGHPSLLTSKLETSCGQQRYLWVFRSGTHGAQEAYVCKARMWAKSCVGPLYWVLPMPSFLHVQDGEASTSLPSFLVAYVWVAYVRSQERMGSIEELCVCCVVITKSVQL